MAIIKVDPQKITGRIKPMHAVGQPPFGGTGNKKFCSFHYLTEIGVPYSRLHDVGGAYGRSTYVDIPNLFRDFNADVNDPASYDFTFTDALISALIEAGIEPYFRLGITIENDAEIKAYRTDPPEDFNKWAQICEHVIAHYIDGWADGFRYIITYWEIWNEPDDGFRVSQMWNGTKEQYYALYEVTAKHLKNVFGDRIKIGGYASSNLEAGLWPEDCKNKPRRMYCLEFFLGFMEHIKSTGAPLDFFSWHSYSSTARTIPVAYWVREQLDYYGFKNAESHLNEWNPYHTERGTEHHSAEITAMMLGMQKAPIDVLVLYDARLDGSSYAALFDPYTLKPFHAYYALAAFNHLYQLKNEIYAECDAEGIYVGAATDGKRCSMVLSNISDRSEELTITGVDLTDARWFVLDQPRLLSWSPIVKTIAKNQVVLIVW